jgi:ribonuclease T1
MAQRLARWLAAAVAALAIVSGAPARESPQPGLVGEIAVAELPREARQTLSLIRQGGPYAYRKDGTTFRNREGHLPRKPRGYYTEYTVRTPGERDRGARRIIAGRGATGSPATGGEYYYTADHYNTFRRIRE